jgi:hypothetical protein
VATLPERTLTILPPAHVAQTPLPAPAIETDDAPAKSDSIVMQGTVWRRVSEALALAWLLTLCAWWWSRKPRQKLAQEPAPLPLHKQQARSLKAARRAAQAQDAVALKAALLDWGRLQWPEDAPRSIGALAMRVDAPLRGELVRLCASTYGPGGTGGWDGAAVAKALRSPSLVGKSDLQAVNDGLPPLMPAGRS